LSQAQPEADIPESVLPAPGTPFMGGRVTNSPACKHMIFSLPILFGPVRLDDTISYRTRNRIYPLLSEKEFSLKNREAKGLGPDPGILIDFKIFPE
jgi:hypothetical protein